MTIGGGRGGGGGWRGWRIYTVNCSNVICTAQKFVILPWHGRRIAFSPQLHAAPEGWKAFQALRILDMDVEWSSFWYWRFLKYKSLQENHIYSICFYISQEYCRWVPPTGLHPHRCPRPYPEMRDDVTPGKRHVLKRWTNHSNTLGIGIAISSFFHEVSESVTVTDVCTMKHIANNSLLHLEPTGNLLLSINETVCQAALKSKHPKLPAFHKLSSYLWGSTTWKISGTSTVFLPWTIKSRISSQLMKTGHMVSPSSSS